MRKAVAVLLCAALLLGLTACGLPQPGYADYDVSGYIRALLDSSYHDAHQDLMKMTGITEGEARENNTVTVENAVARFCTRYGVSATESQYRELLEIFQTVFAGARYTVKQERKVDTGYYLEVEVAPIVNFESIQGEISQLRQQAKAEVNVLTADQENEIFVDKLLAFCRAESANLSYDPNTLVLGLDILQTEEGELQLDLSQLEIIDGSVVRV